MYVMVINVVAMNETESEVNLTINGQSEAISTNAKTVKEVLNEVGYEHKMTDRINHELDDKVSNKMEITVSSEKLISLSNKGDNVEIKTNIVTVAELLEEVGIELSDSDIVIPSLDSNLQDDDEVVIIYHKEEKYTKTVDVKHQTIKEHSFDIPYGEIMIKQKGEDGIKKEIYNKVTKNDIILSDKVISEMVVKEPIAEIIVIGTKEIVKGKIPNETIVENNSSMYEGESKTTQKGQGGQKEVIYKNDGESRIFISEKIVKEPVIEIIQKGVKSKPLTARSSVATSNQYSLSDLQFHGVINSGGKKFTYYSQSVLPGGGLSIPGRHVNAGGYVADKDGYIVVASNKGIPKGTAIDTPFGYKGKVYDVCEACTTDWFDIYTK